MPGSDVFARHQFDLQAVSGGLADTLRGSLIPSNIAIANDFLRDDSGSLPSRERIGALSDALSGDREGYSAARDQLNDFARRLGRIEIEQSADEIVSELQQRMDFDRARLLTGPARDLQVDFSQAIMPDGSNLEDSLSRLLDRNRNNLSGRARQGIVAGDSPSDIFDALVGDAANDRRRNLGATNMLRHHTETFARTAVTAVSNAARSQAYLALDVPLQYVATLDDRTTEICQSLSQQIFRTREELRSPPQHWNCRSILVPVLDRIYREEGLGEPPDRLVQPGAILEVQDGRLVVTGYGEFRDADYNAWFQSQPPEVRELLGQNKQAVNPSRPADDFRTALRDTHRTMSIEELERRHREQVAARSIRAQADLDRLAEFRTAAVRRGTLEDSIRERREQALREVRRRRGTDPDRPMPRSLQR